MIPSAISRATPQATLRTSLGRCNRISTFIAILLRPNVETNLQSKFVAKFLRPKGLPKWLLNHSRDAWTTGRGLEEDWKRTGRSEMEKIVILTSCILKILVEETFKNLSPCQSSKVSLPNLFSLRPVRHSLGSPFSVCVRLADRKEPIRFLHFSLALSLSFTGMRASWPSSLTLNQESVRELLKQRERKRKREKESEDRQLLKTNKSVLWLWIPLQLF